jgi:hypothetical protein
MGFELRRREFIRSNAIRRNLEAILEEGDSPARRDDFPQRFAAIFQMSVPGKSHEDVGDREQQDGSHEVSAPP